MARWEAVEDYLDQLHQQGIAQFTPFEMQASMGIDGPYASELIQAYVREQKKRPRMLKSGGTTGGSRSRFVIHREAKTRTSATVWIVGTHTRDARGLGAATYDDIRNRMIQVVVPIWERMATDNQRLRRLTQAQAEAVVDHVLPLLEMAVQGMTLPQADEQPS
jgi:hypothetical protein